MMGKCKFRLIKSLKASIDVEDFNQEFLTIRGMHLNDQISDEEFKEAASFYFLLDELIYKNFIGIKNNNVKRKRLNKKEYEKLKKEGKIKNVSIHSR